MEKSQISLAKAVQTKRYNKIEQVKVYLGSPWFNDKQRDLVEKASSILQQNQTVKTIHFPFDYQYKNATVKEDKDGIFGTLEWQVATYQNDASAMATSDVGVFLYDMDNLDDGSSFEVGFMRALQKPVLLYPYYTKDKSKYQMNLMLARGVTAFIDKLDELKTYRFDHMPSNPVCPLNVF